ncbi:MAG: transcriptional regulator [Flavobacteriaceae bacterium]|nr:MAG: transcriptional regulator [Flavobacteriaceae bacterium]
MISKRCKYGIKALVYINRNGIKGQGVFSSEISEKENIPKKFLETILRDLKNGQLLNSKRGSKGGYTLNRNPTEITLTEIIRLMDGPIALMPCVSLKYYQSCDECKEETCCKIKSVFEKVRDATLDIYGATSLEDLSKE